MVRSIVLSTRDFTNLKLDEEIFKEGPLGNSEGLGNQKLLNIVKSDLSQTHTFYPGNFHTIMGKPEPHYP
jgi:hypothetical protein